MQFTISAAALVAMAASVLAQTGDFNPVYTPLENEIIPAGSTYEITWDAPAKYADGTITITLIGGASQPLQVPLQQLAAGIPNTDEKFSWDVDASLGAEAVYGLKISLDSDPEIYQYSMPFTIDGSGAPVSSSASSGSPTTVTEPYGTLTVTLSEAPTTTSISTTSISTSEVISTSAVNTTSVVSTTSIVTSTRNSTTTIRSSAPTTVPVFTNTQIVEPPSPTNDDVPPAATTPGDSSAASLTTSLMAVAGVVMVFMAL